MICHETPARADGPAVVGSVLSALAAVIVLALHCTDVRAAETPRLSGLVNASMLARAEAAIARGDQVVEIASPGGEAATGWIIGEKLREAHVAVRCVGVCASAAAQILVASGHCIVSRQGRVGFHRPRVVLTGLSASVFGVFDAAVMKQWHGGMAKAGVPDDLVFRTEQAFRGEFELDEYAMKRVGCTME